MSEFMQSKTQILNTNAASVKMTGAMTIIQGQTNFSDTESEESVDEGTERQDRDQDLLASPKNQIHDEDQCRIGSKQSGHSGVQNDSFKFGSNLSESDNVLVLEQTENVHRVTVNMRDSGFFNGVIMRTDCSEDTNTLHKRDKLGSSSSSQSGNESDLSTSKTVQSNDDEFTISRTDVKAVFTDSDVVDKTLGSGTKQERVNPFNIDLHVDEDHFSDTTENYFQGKRHSTASSKSSTFSHGIEGWPEDFTKTVTFADLGLSEDHFSHPQGHFGLSDAEELELAIDNCKELIKDSVHGSDKQKNLVLKLVQLRIKLHEVKEGPEPVPDNVKVILSHKMLLKNSRTSKYYCERCNGAIWGMLQVWYKCTECGYRCHEKCLQQILRTCARARVMDRPQLIVDLCPSEPNGLASQSYRCAECRSAISYMPGMSEPRLCDYSGRYYCEYCHWNDNFIIPARVLHNWDFTTHKVCRASKQFLKLMQRKAVIRIQDINPMLFVYVDQLNEIKKLREEMMIMKKYILSCPSAMAAKLLLLLEKRQHFVESSDTYSMQDLLDAEERLLPELVAVHSTWAQHIKVDCQLCQGRGFCCELCDDDDVLFPFDNIAVVCAKCSTVLHRHCFSKKCICPRCERRDKRKTAS